MARPKYSESYQKMKQRIEAVKMRKDGATYGKIGEMLGVSSFTAMRLCNSDRNNLVCAECGEPAVMGFRGRMLCAKHLCPDEKQKLNPWSGVSTTCCTE
jgi:hypothetical protein